MESHVLFFFRFSFFSGGFEMFRVVMKGFLEWFWSFRGSTFGGFYNTYMY